MRLAVFGARRKLGAMVLRTGEKARLWAQGGLAVALFFALTCAPNRPSFYILQLQAPNPSPDCTYPSTTSATYLAAGSIAVQLAHTYWGAPLVFNNLVATRNQDGILTSPANAIQVDSAIVRLTFAGAAASAYGASEFTVPISVTVPPQEARAVLFTLLPA